MTRRIVRSITIAAMLVVLLVFAALTWMVPDNRFAVMHDTLMEPAVPMGALVVIRDAVGGDYGDVVGYHPADQSELERLVFGLEVRRYGSSGMYTDAQPDLPARPNEPNKGWDPMTYYVPLVGYVMWFGPIGLLVEFALALIVLFLTREPAHPVAGAVASPA